MRWNRYNIDCTTSEIDGAIDGAVDGAVEVDGASELVTSSIAPTSGTSMAMMRRKLNSSRLASISFAKSFSPLSLAWMKSASVNIRSSELRT